MENVTRRKFACGAGLTALGYSRILGANDRVRMGYIGLGNRGDQVHDAFLEHGDQQTVAVCDLRDDYMDCAVKKSRATPEAYKDYRKLLDDKDVDAVVIATPGPLARADVHRRLQRRQGRVRGEAAFAHRGGRPQDGGGGASAPSAWCRWAPTGAPRRCSRRPRVRALRRHRAGDRGQAAIHIQNEWPNGIGNRPTSRRPATGMGPVAGAGAQGALQPQPRRTTISAGSTTTPAGRSPISACTTWT